MSHKHYQFNAEVCRINGRILPPQATINYLLTIIYMFMKYTEIITLGLVGYWV